MLSKCNLKPFICIFLQFTIVSNFLPLVESQRACLSFFQARLQNYNKKLVQGSFYIENPSLREDFDEFYPSLRDFCHFFFVLSSIICIFVSDSEKDRDIMEKAHTQRFVLDGLKLRKLHALSEHSNGRCSRDVLIHIPLLVWLIASRRQVYIRIGESVYISAWASTLLVQQCRAMRRPQSVGRVTGKFPRFFILPKPKS